MRYRLIRLASVMLVACAGPAKTTDFGSMTAVEHRKAADRENRAADREYEKARDQMGPATPPGATEAPGFGPGAEFFESSWDPMEPEHYTVDERVRIHGEDHAEAARKHRQRAEAHEAAARALESGGRRRVE